MQGLAVAEYRPFRCRPFQVHVLNGLVDRTQVGAPPRYGPAERQRVLKIGRTRPDSLRDGTATVARIATRRPRREPGLEHNDPRRSGASSWKVG